MARTKEGAPQGAQGRFIFRITISGGAHSREAVVSHRFAFRTYFYVWWAIGLRYKGAFVLACERRPRANID